MKTMKIALLVVNNWMVITINGLPHVKIKYDELIGFTSWVEDNGRYYIEWITKDHIFYTEYDNIKKWTTILKLLSE